MRLEANWLNRSGTQEVCKVLGDAGYQALFVGGCVRNTLMGRAASDIDIATDALPEETMRLAERAGLRAIPTGISHGTITIVAEGIAHEVTTFRADVDTDGRHATVQFSTDVRTDAARRDFTMNALYARADGTVIDPLGGIGDLEARRVRFIGTAEKRIREDYLRSLRFFRFFAWYGDQAEGLDAESLAAIAANLDGIARLSKERVGSEMLKLLRAPEPMQALAGMEQSGVLGAVLTGASTKTLGPLVHLEAQAGLTPDPIARLAAIGGQDVPAQLRLSKAEAKQWAILRQEAGEMKTPAHLGYLHGAALGLSCVILRAALLETPPEPGAKAAAAQGANATFPLRAADLIERVQGRALGEALARLEARWIASGFELDRDALLQL